MQMMLEDVAKSKREGNWVGTAAAPANAVLG